MAKYECKVCGYIYNEQHASRSFEELTECPICNEGKENFVALDADNKPVETEEAEDKEMADATSLEEGKEDVTSSDTSEFVVERRQEFWTPLSANTEKKEESHNTTGWTISNAKGSVETVIGSDADTNEVIEEKIVDTSVEEDDEVPAYTSRIESFYSSAEPVRTSHIISGDEEGEQFKPLWNSGGGTVQRVIDPFGDRNDSVVKAEKIDMVMPAEEPVVEEILGEETEEAAEEVLQDVKEYFFDDEEDSQDAEEAAVEEAEETSEAEEFSFEDVAETASEEVVEETAEEEEFGFKEAEEATSEEVEDAAGAEEFSFEEAVETVAEEPTEDEAEAEEFSFEEVEETSPVEPVEETMETEEFGFEEATEAMSEEPLEVGFEEEEDDDFFTEMTMDAMVDNVFDDEEAKRDSGISEEEVFKAIDAIEFDEDVPEGGRIEVVTADGKEEVIFEEETIDEIPEVESDEVFETVEENIADESVEEVIEEASEEEEFSFEEATEAVAEDAAEEAAEEEEFSFEEATEAVEEEAVEETAEEEFSFEEAAEEEVQETVETEESRIKAWSFLDDVVDASGTIAGVTYVSKAMDEVVEEEVTEDDIEEVFVDFAQVKEENKNEVIEEPVAVAEPAPVKEKEEYAYCNNLEKILIVPAQLNPMPLPEGTEVQGKTILGIASDRPLVLDNPVFSTGAYNMVQYIPNSGLTSEDYQKADAIEIIVGHGNGIEKTINSKEDLRQVVNFLRLESDGCPIGIKMGAARIERDLEFCVFAKPDYVVLNNFSVVPLPYALHRATKYLNTVQSDMDIVIALDGAKDAEELAKIMAMGADVIALRNRPAKMEEMMEGLKNYARITGHYDVEDLNVKDLCTIDREIAEYTDIYHV